jgi:hypothetical protein
MAYHFQSAIKALIALRDMDKPLDGKVRNRVYKQLRLEAANETKSDT